MPVEILRLNVAGNGRVGGRMRILKKFSIFKEDKEKSRNLENDKHELLELWEREWENCSDIENDYYNSYFVKLFKDNYEFVKSKTEINKIKNFFGKKVFLVIIIIGVIGYLISILQLFDKVNNGLVAVGESTFCLIAVYLVASVAVKWMDVKKYQETWARHSKHKYQVEQEMMKFILQMNPYEKEGRKREFVKRIGDIWGANQKKFNDNMNNKEKKLNDFLHNIKDFL